ncbi:flagellar assembly protein FliW [bacterium]|nr:flagellar assembly protein FliW [bacterium]
MEIKTVRFGDIEVPESDVIVFAEGLLGFENIKEYILLNTEGEEIFKWLQAVKAPALCFLVIEPELFMFNYSLEISDEDVKNLKINSSEEVEILAIVTVPENPQDMTANLQGPIVLNVGNNMAKQIISGNPSHKVKVPIIKRLEENMKKIEDTLQKEENKTLTINKKRKV